MSDQSELRMDLVPTSVPEWDNEDELAAVLGGNAPEKAGDAQTKAILDKTTLSPPVALDWARLAAFTEQHSAGSVPIPPDNRKYSFYAVQAPLTIILPGAHRLVRLRLILDLHAAHAKPGDVVAYDVFPPTHVDVQELASGEVKLDISKAFQFVLTAAGAAPLAPLAEAVDFKLNLPFHWTAASVTVQSSGRMSNPVEWFVTDNIAIQNGFTPSAILRAPKGSTVTVSATVVGEMRWAGPLGRLFKAQFLSPQPRTYVLK